MAISDKFDSMLPAQQADLFRIAEMAAKSALVPREFQGKPADCLVAIMMGAEVGLKPMQALQSICVINGRPSLWGSGARALIMASGLLESLYESPPDEVEKTKTAHCEIVRKGHAEPFVGQFSMDDARRAGLAGKDNYVKYGRTMLAWRAFHDAARKAFPDIYKGLAAAEELQDTEPFSNGAATVTLKLDAPRDAVPAPETGQGETGVLAGATPGAGPTRRRKTQQEAAPTTAGANENTPSAPPAAAVTPEPRPEPPVVESKATAEQRRALMKAARDLMGVDEAGRWIAGRLKAFGVATGADLTNVQFAKLDLELEEFRQSSKPQPEDF